MENNFSFHPILLSTKPQLFALCRKYEVLTLFVFGSITSQKFNEHSDMDFLVTFGDIPLIDYADYFFDFMHDLEHLYSRKIDLLTENSLTNPYLIESINRNKQLIYDCRNSEISA